MKYLFPMLSSLAFLCAFNYTCSTNKPEITSAPQKVLAFNDTLLTLKTYSTKGAKKVETRIKSVAVSIDSISFNLGLIDNDGNGYQKDDNNLLVITHRQNRVLRINAEFGDPHCPLTNPVYFMVDGSLFKLSDISPEGRSAHLVCLGKSGNPGTTPAVSLSNRVKGLKFQKYSGGASLIDTMFGNKPLIYMYFWTTQPLEYQLKKLENIHQKYADAVRIVGVHNKEHELDKELKILFFELIAKPWNGYYCDTEQYKALYQDYSDYRGLLIDRNGTIIFPHISPKELEEWLQQND